jgi:sugar/nucleoside kinase (ribokinase family)
MGRKFTPLKRPKTLSIGGATFDLFLIAGKNIPEQEGTITLKIGGKIPVERVVESAGGGACNTSVGLSRLNLRASFCGIMGSDQWGEKLKQTLIAEGVNIDPATIVENETSSFSIILTLQSGDRTIFYSPGVNEHLQDTTFDVEAVAHADAVYLNHLSDTACMIEDDIIRTLLKKPERWLSWNPGGPQLEAGHTAPDTASLLRMTNLLLLNKEEALAFTRTKTVEAAFRTLVKSGVEKICITDGKNGSLATDGKHRYRCPCLPVPVVDSTGAGDAFGTAATWALLTGNSLQTALIAGTLNAASVVGTIGAQEGLLTETQMRKKLSQRLLTVETTSL